MAKPVCFVQVPLVWFNLFGEMMMMIMMTMMMMMSVVALPMMASSIAWWSPAAATAAAPIRCLRGRTICMCWQKSQQAIQVYSCWALFDEDSVLGRYYSGLVDCVLFRVLFSSSSDGSMIGFAPRAWCQAWRSACQATQRGPKKFDGLHWCTEKR